MNFKYITQRINVDFLSPNAYWEQFRLEEEDKKAVIKK